MGGAWVFISGYFFKLSETTYLYSLIKQEIMPTEIVTTDDLREFKIELLDEMKKLLQENQGHPGKKWLKSCEVRELLGISQGTLQNLRSNGTLAYTKIGGTMFYDIENIKKMLEKNMVKSVLPFNHF